MKTFLLTCYDSMTCCSQLAGPMQVTSSQTKFLDLLGTSTRKSIITQGFSNTLKHGLSLRYHLLRRTASSDFIFPLVSDLRRASRRKRGNQRYQTRNAITNRFDCLLCILLIYLSYFTTLYWIFFNITLYWRARRPQQELKRLLWQGEGDHHGILFWYTRLQDCACQCQCVW